MLPAPVPGLASVQPGPRHSSPQPREPAPARKAQRRERSAPPRAPPRLRSPSRPRPGPPPARPRGASCCRRPLRSSAPPLERPGGRGWRRPGLRPVLGAGSRVSHTVSPLLATERELVPARRPVGGDKAVPSPGVGGSFGPRPWLWEPESLHLLRTVCLTCTPTGIRGL